MSVSLPPESSATPSPELEPQRIPLRWAFIVVVSAAVGVITGQSGDLVAGILAGGGTAVALHTVMG